MRARFFTVWEKNLNIINITHDIEDSIYGRDIVLISDKRIITHDKKEKIFNNEKLLKKVGFEPPFMANLSLKLRYYNLIDKLILDMNEMVKTLWK